MKRVRLAALLAALSLPTAGCGAFTTRGTTAVGEPRPLPKSSSRARAQLRVLLRARPIWIRLALLSVGGDQRLVWLGFSPAGNPVRECPRPPCRETPGPVAAYVDARGNGVDGWADVHPAGEPASPLAVIRALGRRHEHAQLVALG